MAQPQYPPPEDERWNVNLPAVIGVVFVFLVGVVIWVIAASGDDDGDTDAAASSSSTTTEPVDVTTSEPGATSTTAPGTTSPAPMPDPTTSTSTTSSTSTTAPATTTTTSTTTTEPTPPTTAEGADPGAVPGDLGIAGFPMQAPPCTDSFITIIASAVGADVAPAGIRAYLDDYPTSNYLRTDQTCPSLAQDIDGEPIYVVYFGPFPFASDACEARAEGTEGSYVRTLSETEPPNHSIDCGD
jgi:hypothetical protein